MLKYKIHPLIHKTAADLDMSLDVVSSVVLHEFETIKNNIVNPTHLGYRLEDLGKFFFKRNQYYSSAFRLLVRYRKGTVNKELLQKFIRMRHLVNEYYFLQKYKRRFGSWHWK